MNAFKALFTTFGSYSMRESSPVSIPSAITGNVLATALLAAFRALPARNRQVLLGTALVVVGLTLLAKAR